ncbi:hypothetical protein [Hyphomonas sp.]|uniref:hypothetical protein n=1 Tax=Hyphomonas sp. TaxID=87 RepID=UPI00391AFFCF
MFAMKWLAPLLIAVSLVFAHAPAANAQEAVEISERNFSVSRLGTRHEVSGVAPDGTTVRYRMEPYRLTAKRNVRFNGERLKEGDVLQGWARSVNGQNRWIVPPSREVTLVPGQNVAYARRAAGDKTLILIDLITGDSADSGLAGLHFAPSSYPVASFEERNGRFEQVHKYGPSFGYYLGVLPDAAPGELALLGPRGEAVAILSNVDQPKGQRVISYAEHEQLLAANPLLQHQMRLVGPDTGETFLPVHQRRTSMLTLIDYPVMATKQGAFVVRHRQPDGAVSWGIYGRDGSLLMPMLDDLHFTFKTEADETSALRQHIPYFVFMVPLDVERNLYWPIRDDGRLAAGGNGIRGIRPIFGADFLRDRMGHWPSGYSNPWIATGILWENDGEEVWAIGNRPINDDRIAETRTAAVWEGWQVIDWGVRTVEYYSPNTDAYGIPLANNALRPMLARAAFSMGLFAQMKGGPVFILTPDEASPQPAAWFEMSIGPFVSYQAAQNGLTAYNSAVIQEASQRSEVRLAEYRTQRAQRVAENEQALRNLALRSIERQGPGSEADVALFCAHRDAAACEGVRARWQEILNPPPPDPRNFPGGFGALLAIAADQAFANYEASVAARGRTGPSELGPGYSWYNGKLYGPNNQVIR